MKFWQYLALASGVIICVVMALASVSYSATLGTNELAFAWLPVTNTIVFSFLALAFDLGMIASVFGFWHWRASNHMAAAFCAILFVIASLFSIHSVRGYIALNITKSLAPMERGKDVYSSLKLELSQAQSHLSALRHSLLKARRRARARLRKDITSQIIIVHETRARMAGAKDVAQITPLAGLEWFLAVTLWFFNATCWTAWFGTKARSDINLRARHRAQQHEPDGVRGWLTTYRQSEPEHCARLHDRYAAWCTNHFIEPLSARKFYALLIVLGARKFRDGRDGPMLYELPKTLPSNARLET